MLEVIIETNIDAPAELVWQKISNLGDYPLYSPHVRNCSGILATGKPIKAVIKIGALPLPLVVWIKDYQEPQRFSWGEPALLKVFSWLISIEHYFVVEKKDKETSRLIHGEKLTGLLAWRRLQPIFNLVIPYYSGFNNNVKKTCENEYKFTKTRTRKPSN